MLDWLEECCGFWTGRHPTPAFESGPSGPIMAGSIRGIGESADKQMLLDEHLETNEAKPTSRSCCNS